MKTSSYEVLPDILFMSFTIVNAFLIGNPGDKKDGWVLVDTGLENSAGFIIQSAEKRFHESSKPRAIILTHGHFDHVGTVKKLSEFWNVPVYAHRLEMPYITGLADYPVPDPAVDEGLVAKMSPNFPHSSIDISSKATALPDDGNLPGLSDWKWIHTPSHSEGHISLFREKDRTLIVGDAFSTTKQESLLSVMAQDEQISGPPKYLTTDWDAAKKSVKALMELEPSIAIPSHGKPMKGKDLSGHLEMIVRDFDEVAKPEQGRFV